MLDVTLKDQAELGQEIKQVKKVAEAEVSKFSAQQEELYKQRAEELENKAISLLEELDKNQQKSREILGIVGEEAVTTEFATSALSEGKSANRYRWASIFAMTVAVGLLGWLVYDISNSGFSWEVALVRVMIAAILFVPATYMARESSSHRTKEAHYRRMALELSALAPFIQELDEEDRKQKIKEMTDRYFGQEFPDADDNSINLDLLSQAASIIKKAN